MTTYAWPTAFVPASCTLHLEPNLREFASPWTGSYSVVDLMGERWRMTVTLPPRLRRDSGALEGFFNRLRGVHLLTAWHFGRPTPSGTIAGSPVLSTGVAQGLQSLPITTTAFATVKAGDMLGVAGQLFQVAADATASAGGALTALTVNRARAALSGAAAVTWSKPTATFRLANPAVPVQHLPSLVEGVEIELIETW